MKNVPVRFEYDAARTALAKCVRIDEVKKIQDQTAALKEYARRQKDRQLIDHATRLREDAEWRMGELLLIHQKSKGVIGRNKKGKTRGNSGLPRVDEPPTYEKLGVDKMAASRAQRRVKAGRAAHEAKKEENAKRAVASVDADAKREMRADEEAEREAERDARRKNIDQGCTVDDLRTLAEKGRKFSVIYADPPWEFKVYSGAGKQRSADRHYDTQGLDYIKALPVAALAADDCALFLWCVMPELPGALDVIKAWGFEYKTVGFTWVKQNKKSERPLLGHGLLDARERRALPARDKGKPQAHSQRRPPGHHVPRRRAQREASGDAATHRAPSRRPVPRTVREGSRRWLDGLGR